MNRLKGTLYDGETRLGPARMEHPSRCTRWAAWPSTAVIPATSVFPLTDGVDLERVCCSRLRGDDGVWRYQGTAASSAAASESRWSGVGGVGSMVVDFARALGALQVDRRRYQRREARGSAGRVGATDVVERARDETVQSSCRRERRRRRCRLSRSWDGGADIHPGSGECSATESGRSPSESPRRVCTTPIEITRLVRRGLRDPRGRTGPGRGGDMQALLEAVASGVFASGDGDLSRTFPLRIHR